MNRQDKTEILIFEKFAKICPYNIEKNSIKKKNPPEPDIECTLSDKNTIAFELVQSIDNSIASSTYDSINIEKAFHATLENLSDPKKEEFMSKFANASIYVSFDKSSTVNKRKKLIPAIIDTLLKSDDITRGEVNLHSFPNLRKSVRSIHIDRGEFQEPIFGFNSATSFGEPCMERIKGKFAKRYETKHKIDLLIYYELQPELPEDQWFPAVKEYIKNNIKKTVFKRVWLYSVTKNKIIFNYPLM